MALVKTSALISEISGKVGGNVFARTRGGLSVRQFTKPINPNTDRQQTQRNKLAAISNAWKGLTQAQRQAWTEAATLAYRQVTNRMGETTTLTGPQMFLKVNLLLQTATQDDGILINPPAPVVYPDVTVSSATFDNVGGNYVIVFDVKNAPADEFTYVLGMTPSTPNGQTPRAFRNIGPYADGAPEYAEAAGTVTLTIPLAEVEAVVGTRIAGLKQSLTLQPISTDDPWGTIKDKHEVDA